MKIRSALLAGVAAILVSGTAFAQTSPSQTAPAPGDTSAAPAQTQQQDRTQRNRAQSQEQRQEQRSQDRNRATQRDRDGDAGQRNAGDAQSNERPATRSTQDRNNRDDSRRTTQSPSSSERSTTQSRQRSQDSDTGRNAAESAGDSQPAQQRNRASQSGSTDRSANRAATAAPSQEQQTRISAAISRERVSPVRVNFNISVGTTVPRTVRLAAVPASILSIAPQYRGYRYFVTEERIVFVEPSSTRIVAVMPYGDSRAASGPSRSRLNLTAEQRRSIRSEASSRPATTGSARQVTRTITVEEEVPSEVELIEFPDTIVREVPSVRSYRYYRSGGDVIVVDPGSRRVLEVID